MLTILLYLLFFVQYSNGLSKLNSENSELSKKMKEFYSQYNSTAAVSYVADLNHVCSYGSAGYAQIQNRKPLFDSTGRIHMGSNTKSMTAALIGILLENHQIQGQTATNGWQTTMSDIFSYAKNTPYENITLAALSSHFSGLASVPDNFWDFDISSQSLFEQRENLTYTAFQSTPVNKPNTTFSYSNWGFIVLGHVIEVSLNMPWEQALRTYFLEPLQMIEKDSPIYPYGAPTGNTDPWGHIPLSASVPHFPCDPNNPADFEVNLEPTFQCDNPTYFGPAGTYSGYILSTANYYMWLLQCSQGLQTQHIRPLSQKGCQELMEPYGLMDAANTSAGSYGHGWAMAELIINDEKIKVLNHAGSNTYNYVEVELYPSLGKIYWAGTNSGYSTDQAMVAQILRELKTYDFIQC